MQKVKAREGASAASIAAHNAFITARKSRNAARVLLEETILLVHALEASQEAYEKTYLWVRAYRPNWKPWNEVDVDFFFFL